MATIQSKLAFQDEMSSKLEKISTRLQQTAKSTRLAKDHMEAMRKKFGETSSEFISANQVYQKHLQNLQRVSANYKQTKAALGEVAKEVERLKNMSGVEKLFYNLKSGMKEIFTGVSGKIAASMKIADMAVQAVTSAINNLKEAVKQSIQDYSKYQSTLTDVNNLLDRSDPLYEQNKANLQAASKAAIRNGISIEDANTALFNSVSAIGDANTAIKTYESAQILAKAGATNLATATDGLTNVINAYRLSADEANDVSTAFFRAQVVGKTTVGELAAAIGGVAPIAKSAGVSYKELLATMSVLTKGGLDTASAATALRASMTALIKPSKQASEVLKKYGVPVGAAELQSKGLAYALVQLQKAAEANPDTMAEMIPNIRALTGVSTLTAESLELVQKTIADMNNDIANGSGMMEAYADKMNTLETVQNRFKGANQDLALTIGSILEPIVKAFLTTLTNLVNFINSAIQFVMEFADILKVVLGGAVVFIIGKFIIMNVTMQGVAATAKMMWAAIASPITIIIGIITALVAIIDKIFGLTFKDNVQSALSVLYMIETFCKNLITRFENLGIAIHNAFHPDDKLNYKDLEDNSLYSNMDKAKNLMDKMGWFKDKKNTGAPSPMKTPETVVTGKGGKPVATEVKGEVKIREEDIELLHDLATRDFMLNYQQLTPQITIPGMVIHEEADVNQVIDRFASAVTELVDTNLSLNEGSLAA